LNDAIERGTIDHEVFQDREGVGAPPGSIQMRSPSLVRPHGLTGRGRPARAVRRAVDDDPARAADALPAIVLERDRVLAALRQPLVDDVEHLEKRRVRADVLGLVANELTGRLWTRLPPNVEDEVHYL
jgi:hypothetical protein